MGLTAPPMQRIPLVSITAEQRRHNIRLLLLSLPWNIFLGTREEYVAFQKTDMVEVWDCVYDERTLLRPAQGVAKGADSLLRAVEGIHETGDELLRAGEA